MNQSQEKTASEILNEGIDQAQLLTLKIVVTMLEKYPTDMVLASLKNQVAELEDRASAREQDHE